MAELDTDVRYLKGVGEKRAETLAKLGIRTLRDLVSYFPRTYEDRSQTVPIALAAPDVPVCIHALVATEPTLTRIRRGMELVKFRIVDDSGAADVTYFNQSYLRNSIKRGGSYIFFGKVAFDGAHRAMTNPVFEREDGPHAVTGRIVPVYHLTAGVSQKQLLAAVRQGLDDCAGKLPNALPDAVAEKAGLCQNPFAYENIHFPKDFDALALAENRLVFEELFVLACALTRMKNARVVKAGPIIAGADIEEFYRALPFTPTGAQKRAIAECLADMASGSAMNRLVQGDVGSGKTLVAAACIWAAHRAGLQCAFMAPTEILASQHVDTFTELLSPFGIRVVKLTGALTAKQKREALALLADGEADLAVGTHALLSEGVAFQNLGLVVTDEQHRFGVGQRAALVSKGESPHTLVMSATPIPRTLALIIYGDLDVSVIDEMPPGRQKVDTFAVGEDMRERITKFIRKQVAEGHQVFIVCPAVEENEERPMDLKSAKEYAAELQTGVFSDLRVGCVHGKLRPAEKEKVMRAFVDGELDILVSTTVVEVGVDVPNATLMVVENAERFGLSQLHQLRGRVGRGKAKSYCVLFSDADNDVSKERLKVLEGTNDGFKISEEDLRLRGPGDFFGARQHGLPEMHIASLCTDMRILRDAQDAANALLQADPELKAPENARLRAQVDRLFQESAGTMN